MSRPDRAEVLADYLTPPKLDPYEILTFASIIYLSGYFSHFIDHLAIGLWRTPTGVLIGGSLDGIGGVVSLLLARRRNPLAAPMAVAVGFPGAIGIAAVHIPPYWGPFSEPFTNASAASWATVACAMLGGVVLGCAGVYVLRARAVADTSG